ncbi:MAG: hypothetical protein K2J47_00400 [Ruminococcus sp.]|nr:hypothetical protein [Ruminococcus sp.]
MKNENNHGVEELLKNKMNELSESVDCFDRISARAFPEEDEDFSESGFTISDLENVTGKARRIRVVRWIAAAVAVVCIAVIPQTNFANNILSNIGSGSVRKNYENLISEINSETQNGDYLISDYPLNYYIQNDVLVTPLFVCPFEDCGKEDANVRIYTRQINGFNTNQVYAVEYIGTYSEENIIAAAQSEYTFSAEDITYAEQYSTDDFNSYSDCSYAIVQNFSTDSDGLFIDDDGDSLSLASFVNFTLIKYDGGIIPVSSEILYGHKTMSDDSYFYDIISTSENKKIQINEREKSWKKSVYFNDNTAMPKENHSIFTKKNLFNGDLSEQDNELMFIFSFKTDYRPEKNEIINVYSEASDIQLSSIIVPYDDFALSSTRLYFSSLALDGDTRIIVKSNKQSQSVHYFDTVTIISDEELEYQKYTEELIKKEEARIYEEQNKLGSAE